MDDEDWGMDQRQEEDERRRREDEALERHALTLDELHACMRELEQQSNRFEHIMKERRYGNFG